VIRMFFDGAYTIEEAERLTGLKYIEFPDIIFERTVRNYDLNNDQAFERYLREIDNCDIPMPNVARDLITGNTHSFDKISTGVRMLWLMTRLPDRYLYPTQWLGENCYQSMFDIGRDTDVWVYEDSQMFANEEADACTGQFLDVKAGNVVTIGDDRGFDYWVDMDYNQR